MDAGKEEPLHGTNLSFSIAVPQDVVASFTMTARCGTSGTPGSEPIATAILHRDFGKASCHCDRKHYT